MRERIVPVLGLAALFLMAVYSKVTATSPMTWYVSPSCGSDSNSGQTRTCGTSSGPFASTGAANSVLNGGDTVDLLPGTYNATIFAQTAGISHLLPTQWICDTDQACFVTYTGSRSPTNQAVYISAAHIRIGYWGHGIDITAHGSACDTGAGGSLVGQTTCAPAIQTVGTGIFDTQIISDYVHDSPGGGIVLTGGTDWSDIEGDICNHTAYGTVGDTSCITQAFGTLQTYSPSSDMSLLPYGGQYNNYFANDVAYNTHDCEQAETWSSSTAYTTSSPIVYWPDGGSSNYAWQAAASSTNSAPATGNSNWTRLNQVCLTNGTDGNGFLPADTMAANGHTSGPTLVEHLFSFCNGGRGIHIVSSAYVTVRNSLMWSNLTDGNLASSPTELSMQNCSHCQYYNNVILGTAGTVNGNAAAAMGINLNPSTAPSVMDYNVGVMTGTGGVNSVITSSPGSTIGAATVYATPTFAALPSSCPSIGTKLTLAQVQAWFRPATGSPVLGAGSAIFGPTKDSLGNARPRGYSLANFGTSMSDAGPIQVEQDR